MKQLSIIALLWLLAGANTVQAQTNFTETYKKAYAFTTSQPDSALHWAYKSAQLAHTPQENYDAYYLLAYAANKLCLPSLATEAYQKAVVTAPDSSQKYKAINSLAKAHFIANNYYESNQFNTQSMVYFSKVKDLYNLSYAYELKGMILKKQDDYNALTMLHKAMKLRQKTDAKRIGISYHELAAAFAHFGLKDSAIVYQRKALANYPIKTPDRIAIQHILLAKYLLLADQTSDALPHLQTAERLRKRPLTELLWCHTFGLYLSRLDVSAHAKRIFARCDSLLTRALAAAPDAPTRKAISAQAVDMYADALKIKALPDSTRLSYQAQLKLAQKHLKAANADLKLKESYYSQQLGKGGLPLGGTNIWMVASVLFGTAGLVFGCRMWWQRSQQVPTPNVEGENLMELQRLVQENKLIKEVIQILGKNANRLNFHEREAIRQLSRGKSYNKIGDDVKEGGAALRVKFNRFAKDAGYNTMLELIKQTSQRLAENE